MFMKKNLPYSSSSYYEQGVNDRALNVYHLYNSVEVVNRAVNLIADNFSEITIDVKDVLMKTSDFKLKVKKERLNYLLNIQANIDVTAMRFKRDLALDLLLDGNAFIYFDGNWIYQLPAQQVTINPAKDRYVKSYYYGGEEYFPEEIIHIKDNSAPVQLRGVSRMLSMTSSGDNIKKMQNYHKKLFDNDTAIGVVLKSPHVLSKTVKERLRDEFMADYSASKGKRPLILDADLQLDSMGTTDLRELDYQNSYRATEERLCLALGVPYALLDPTKVSGIQHILKLFYLETILPLFNLYVSGLECFFRYDLKPALTSIVALQPDVRDKASYLSTLVNNGIMTINEARAELRLPESEDEIADSLIKPQNVAGSALDPSLGGRPEKEDENNE